jgi:hypothetical protein
MEHSKRFDTKIINMNENPFMIHEQKQSSTRREEAM